MNLLDLWRRAVASEVGISIETDDRQLLRQQLYRARGEDFADIVIVFPVMEGELWLVKRDEPTS